ncbi:MAG: glycosyltransferase [Defluviitaleaceae bacterium]|nr:glycosyltransferase [Defluviitaleaceae bacterium]
MTHLNNIISIIMPVYNGNKTIKASIESILNQTYLQWELIIVDDASIDNTVDIIKSFIETDSRIILHLNKYNQGVAVARNVGIKQAIGKYIAFLDSDDLWHTEKLMKQFHYMEKNNVLISFTRTAYINTLGKIHKYIAKINKTLNYKQLLRRNIMSCSSVMVRREIMMEFPKGYIHEDYAVWLKIVKKTGLAHGINETLVFYRISEHSKSSKRIGSAIMTRNTYLHIGYGRFTSTLLTFRYAFHSITKRSLIRIVGVK